MNAENGNVLFLILIAVALFAALSYAVTSSTRGGGGNASKESAKVSAARVLSYASALRSGVMRLMTVNAVPITSLRFNNDIYQRNDGTVLLGAMGTPANPALYVFHPEGGGVIPQTFEDISVPCPTCTTVAQKPGHGFAVWFNNPDVGTAVSDMSFNMFSFSDDVCTEINKQMGITGIPNLSLPGSLFTTGGSVPTGQGNPVGTTTADSDAVKGVPMFCYKETTTAGRNVFVNTLKEY